MQSCVVEPIDPFQGRELDVSEGLPRAFSPDLLGLEQADRGLGQGVVVGVADAAYGRVDAGVDEPLGKGETDVWTLTAVVVMMNEPCAGGQTGPLAGPKRHLERV